jgi:mono/diheme cytochrome c family protein
MEYTMKNLITILLLAGTSLWADIDQGKKVYASSCAICHTVNGGSALGPDLNIVSYTRKKEDLAAYIKEPYNHYERFGYSANAMPALPLEDKEIEDVVDYIDSLQPFKKWMKK